MALAATPVRVAMALTVIVLTVVVLRDPLLDGTFDDDVADLVEQEAPPPGARDLRPYEGLGTWVDAFDYGPAYQPVGQEPAVTPADVDEMADAGVRTLYLQANRDDERSPDGWVDEELLGEFVVRAHEQGMAVVGWYLPTFRSVRTDVALVRDLLEYEVAGHRLDGVGVDIEYTEGAPDPAVRNDRLLRLSERVAALAADEPVSAIVLPPVLLEVVNPDLWPDFPWADLEPLYDIWLPMSYWTLRTEASGYQDGATYHAESVTRLRANLGDEAALVHGIGGVGDASTGEDLVAFVGALEAEGAVGGSIYDWATLSESNRSLLARLFADYAG